MKRQTQARKSTTITIAERSGVAVVGLRASTGSVANDNTPSPEFFRMVKTYSSFIRSVLQARGAASVHRASRRSAN